MYAWKYWFTGWRHDVFDIGRWWWILASRNCSRRSGENLLYISSWSIPFYSHALRIGECAKDVSPALDVRVTQVKWQFTLVYLDFIGIFSRTQDKHLKHVDQLLTLLHDAGLQLNLKTANSLPFVLITLVMAFSLGTSKYQHKQLMQYVDLNKQLQGQT